MKDSFRISLTSLCILLSLNIHGQDFSAHQLRLNDIGDFGFDPRYLIKGEGANTFTSNSALRQGDSVLFTNTDEDREQGVAIAFSGRQVGISSISVKPTLPWKHPDDGRHYEIIRLPHGVDWQAAYNMAKRKS